VKLGLPLCRRNWREDHGEFAAGEKNDLPRLVEWADLKGALHNHSTWSDGHNRLEEIAEYMEDLGLAYWAITDHSKSSFRRTVWTPNACGSQIAEIKKINGQFADRGSDFRLAYRDGSGYFCATVWIRR